MFNLRNPSGDVTASLQARATGSGGSLYIFDNAETNVATMQAQANGGGVYAMNTAGDIVASMFSSVGQDGTVNVADNSQSNTINLSGQSGVVTCVSVNQTSSRKVKENIKPIEDASKILELDAVSFDFKNKARGTNRRGFVAEDVAKVLPNLVTPETEEVPASLNYVEMIPYLQAVIKEQEARIKALEEKINNIGG